MTLTFLYQNLFSYTRTSKDLSAGYYQKQRKASKKACDRYQDLSEEEKNKRQKYGCKQYNNLPGVEKQRLVEYKTIYNMGKKHFTNKG